MWATLIKVENPACSWCRVTSMRHPGVRMEVLAYHAMDEAGALEDVKLTGASWPDALRTIRATSPPDAVEVLEESPESARIRLRVGDCPLPHAVRASGALPQFPFVVQGGADQWLLIAPQEKARDFHENVAKSGVKIEVLSSTHYEPTPTLTPRQKEILNAAVAAGYYDYPRRVTLTQLADRLGIAKSTLSQSLMLIEREVFTTLFPNGRAA